MIPLWTLAALAVAKAVFEKDRHPLLGIEPLPWLPTIRFLDLMDEYDYDQLIQELLVRQTPFEECIRVLHCHVSSEYASFKRNFYIKTLMQQIGLPFNMCYDIWFAYIQLDYEKIIIGYFQSKYPWLDIALTLDFTWNLFGGSYLLHDHFAQLRFEEAANEQLEDFHLYFEDEFNCACVQSGCHQYHVELRFGPLDDDDL